jgi:NDP-sugar pyrophosphorylase family protein
MPHTIRKAVLLAAGRGRRLGDLTAGMPKPLLVVAGKPILAHILEALASAGIEEAVVVAGYRAAQVETFCTRFGAENPGLKVTTVRQHELNGTSNAMLAAMQLLAGEIRFVFGWGDILMTSANYARFMKEASAADYDLLLAVNRTDDPYRGAAVYLDPSMRVQRIVEKPPRGTSSTHWNNSGLFASRPQFFDYLQRLVPSKRRELELPEAIAAMIREGLMVRAVDIRGFWSDIGTPEDLRHARSYYKPESLQ